jgi:hypothetical protein
VKSAEITSCLHSAVAGVIVLDVYGKLLIDEELLRKRVMLPSAVVDIPSCFLGLVTTISCLLSPLKSPKVMPSGFPPASYSTTASKTVPETLEGTILDSVGKSVELHAAVKNVPELTRNKRITVLKLRLGNNLVFINQAFKKETIFVFMIVLN